MRIAIVDMDDSEISNAFADSLKANENLNIEPDDLDAAKESVRKGRRVGLIVIPKGFGETAGIIWQTPPKIQMGMDPSRSAEAAMLQGFVMEAMGGLIGQRFNNPNEFRPMVDQTIKDIEESDDIGIVERQTLKTLFGSFDKMLDSMEQLQADEENDDVDGDNSDSQMNIQFADIEYIDISREVDAESARGQTKKLKSKWDISFPQAMMWGVLACCAGFAISIARENTMGTMVRLQAAPISRFQILSGKALACFLTVLGVVTFMTLLGLFVGMRPGSYPKLILASLCVAACFVGIMMTMAVLGKTEQSINGIGWAINMVMAMAGGAMVPVMFMPGFMQKMSVLSPVKWSILSIEGAIWRDFSYYELMLPCGILLLTGTAGMLIGTAILKRR